MDEDTIIYYGEPIKALGDGKVGGYLVRFTNETEPDLVGEFFTKDTDLGDATTAPVYYQHGQDPTIKTRKLGSADLKHDDFGVWAESQLSLRDEYEKFLARERDLARDDLILPVYYIEADVFGPECAVDAN